MKTNPETDVQDKCKLFESEWKTLDDRYGAIDQDRFILTMDEWRDRKILILIFVGAIGMGASLVSGGRDLSNPLSMGDYHKCPENCPNLDMLRQKRRAYP